ncbi:type 1 glutamine amidotransferase domain-containing protein [Pyruvatibacter mobilis]|uniref:type 1 glutamine amidotransferase domain-containing protein n=1 Tax=Pyruvatibacter mobilis TaxID=1712261 RepID=UPI003C7B7E23
MADLKGKRIALLATHGFEQSELEVPRDRLAGMGAEVHVIAPEDGDIKGWDGDDWGRPVPVDKTLDQASMDDYDALVLPGGQINPDLLRVNDDALAFIKRAYESGKVLAAICHAPWLLVETGIAEGATMTSYPSVKTDVKNAGATWVDEAVVADNGLITSRNPDDLEVFSKKIAEETLEGQHTRAAA